DLMVRRRADVSSIRGDDLVVVACKTPVARGPDGRPDGRRSQARTEVSMPTDATIGPVELAVIEFPGSQFNAEIVPALAELVDTGIVRIIDLVLVTKELDGSITSIELNELGEEEQAAFDQLDGEVNGLLSDEDLAAAGDALGEGNSAMLIVWENSWA